MIRFDLDELRLDLQHDFNRVGTASVKRQPRGGLMGEGHVTSNTMRDAFVRTRNREPALPRSMPWYRASVGSSRRSSRRPARRSCQVHYGDPIRDVPNRPQVVRE